MKRHRELHFDTTSYIVSSYSSHAGVDLREKFARKLLTTIVNRAQTKFKFRLRRLKIETDHFVMVLMSPAKDGRLLPKTTAPRKTRGFPRCIFPEGENVKQRCGVLLRKTPRHL